jgi:hypothetical protein
MTLLAPPSVTPRELVTLANALPAAGAEQADWRLRGIAELLMQALVTQDGELAREAVAAGLAGPAAGTRFVERFEALRKLTTIEFALRTDGHPTVRESTPVDRAAPGEVRRAAIRLARFLDLDPPTGAVSWRPRSAASAHALGQVLDDTARLRPAGRTGHRCVRVWVPPGLTWRAWIATEDGPMLAATPRLLTDAQLTVWFGLHVGTHLDLLAQTTTPHRWQFGRGLLVAEALSSALEICEYARCRTLDPAAAVVLRDGLVERLARLPGIAQWGPAMAPGSAAITSAVAIATPEFTTLPTLTCAYVAGPARLAAGRFRYPGVPHVLADELHQRWRLTGFETG